MAEVTSRWLQQGTPDSAFKECVVVIDYARKENPDFVLGRGDVTHVSEMKDTTAFARVLLLYESKMAGDVDGLYSRLSAHFGLSPAPARPGAPRSRPLARPPFYLYVGI